MKVTGQNETPPTKWGIVTCGKISTDFTIALQTLNPKEHAIVAVAARDLKKAQQFAEDFGIAKSYGSYKELAEDAEVGKSKNRMHYCTDSKGKKI